MQRLLPVLSVVVGLLFPVIAHASGLVVWFLGAMLWLAFLRMDTSFWRVPKTLPRVLAVYLVSASALWFVISPVHPGLASALAATAAAPTATASPAVLSLLGRDPAYAVTSVLVTHLLCSVVSAPLVHGGVTVMLVHALPRVLLVLAIPALSAFVVRRFLPLIASWLNKNGNALQTWLWSLAVLVASARTGLDLRHSGEPIGTIALVGAGTAVLCCLQFALGYWLGGKNEGPEASQSLGQKNTLLMIWMAQHWMGPVAALGPMFHVVWQNLYMAVLFHRVKGPPQ